MRLVTTVVDGLLELLAPQRCVLCERRRAELDGVPAAWATGAAGPAPGLRPWHAPHLCARCLASWHRPPLTGAVQGRLLLSALPESAALVRVVGDWKYRGLRGLARPLASLLVPVLLELRRRRPEARLVPVPLHPRRRRERGFDQCLQLAVLAGREAGLTPVADLLRRRRRTEQQASRPVSGEGRLHNVAGAFAARPPFDDEARGLILLDDLATSGATLASAADACAAAGWRVVALAALGQAGRLRA